MSKEKKVKEREFEKDQITKTIKAKVFDINNGLTEYDNVLMVRIKSSNNNQLIMAEHLPIITRVDKHVIITTTDDEYCYDPVNGYCMYREGLFTLMIEDKYNVV